MATYHYSALAEGQAISFNPNVDLLIFDISYISASSIRVISEGANLRILVPNYGKDVVLLNTTQPQLANSNISFIDNSQLLIGDNTPGTANDGAANSLVGTGGNDLLAGLGGADTLNGGAGNDTYVVTTGDVLIDSGGVDTIVADTNWTLGAAFENLEMAGSANLSGNGNNLNNTMFGNAGNNYFNGRAGSDSMHAGAGNDTIDMSTGGTGLQGQDLVDGGEGIDTVDYDGYAASGLQVELSGYWAGGVRGGGIGGEGSATLYAIERFVGGAFNDTISGYYGDYYLDGRGGDDFVSGDWYGAWGNQTLLGGSGNDTLAGGAGNDSLSGGTGADRFVFQDAPGAANADRIIDFASGADELVLDNQAHQSLGPVGDFASGDARFWSSASGTAHDADDRIIYNTSTGQLWHDSDGTGANAAQLIATLQPGAALAATDIAVTGNAGNGPGVHLTGTAGSDTLEGGEGDDTLEGLGGNDSLYGSGGNDRVDGGAGDDTVAGGAGADTLVGGDGNDTLEGSHSESWGSWEPDADTMDGGAGDDYYVVDNPNDFLVDSGGIDFIRAYDMDWTLAEGFENLHLHNDISEGSSTGIGNGLDNRMSLGWGGGRLEGLGGNDTLGGGTRGSELFGGAGNDELSGNERATLDGGDGNDTLLGGSMLDGGAGDDWLDGNTYDGWFEATGGSGADSFIFHTAWENNSQRVTDFASGEDVLRVDATEMRELGASGRLAAGDARFYAAAGATGGHDADDRLVYNTSNGELFYDADGIGSQAAARIATLQPGAALAATDIVIDNGSLTLTGTSGNDSIAGSTGSDSISGLGGNDTLEGGDGHDTLDGGAGMDSMDGGEGSDTYYVTSGDVVRDSGTSFEYDYLFTSVDWTLAEDSGIERITLLEGSAARDFSGNSRSNFIDGNSADNFLDGGGGEDYLHGGAGNDTLIGVETEWDDLYGEDGNDVLVGGQYQYGGTGDDRLTTGDGNQELSGEAGNDTLAGGAGNDVFYGGAGADVFILADAPGQDFFNTDRFSDFLSGTDKAHFDASVFTGLGADGNFSNGDERFYAAAGASAAHDASDRLIFDTSTGKLWYDSDGAGGSAAVLAATFVVGWSTTPTPVAATDIVVINGAPPTGNTITGTEQADSLTGTSGDDLIDARGGNDSVRPLEGNDTVFGGAGFDAVELSGNYGNDVLDGGGDFDAISMATNVAAGIVASFAAGTLTGGSGSNVTFTGFELVSGTAFADRLDAGGVAYVVQLDGHDGNDTLIGGNAGDELNGWGGNDHFIGGGGNDIMDGFNHPMDGADTMEGGAGDDLYYVGQGDVVIENAGSGIDWVNASVSWALGANFENLMLLDGAVTANGNALGNVIFGNEGHNSSINGRAGDDIMYGMGGNDVFDMSTGGTSSYGDDMIDGGAGIDSIEFGANARSAVTVNLAANTVSGGGDGGAGSIIVLGGVENALGGNFNDTLIGDFAANYFRGSGGNDTLNGGAGNDRLQGDAGNDAFVFDAIGAANSDTIVGFASGADKVHLDDAVMAALGAAGNFTAGDVRYWEAAGATSGHDANDRVVYNTTNGNLYYDADGSGSGAAQLIATLQGAPAFTDTDVFVI